MNNKVTLLGLDGVSWKFVNELSEEAEIPNLESIVESTVHGTTKSTIPCLTCPALPTMYTGVNPGNLGIFDFVKPDGGIVDYQDVKEPAVWDYLTEEKIDSVVAAMRTTHPAPNINGVFISDILSPKEENRFVTPESEREKVEKFHRLRDQLEKDKKSDDDEALLDSFIEMNDERIDVILDLLYRHDPQFALLWIGLTDGIQHYFWHDRESLYRFFERFDERLGELKDSRLDKDHNLIVIGDHGFGPATEKNFHLNEVLKDLGYLKMRGGRARQKVTKFMYNISEKYMSDQIKKHVLNIYNSLPRSTSTAKNSKSNSHEKGEERVVVSEMNNIPGIDWGRTKAHVSTRKGWGVNIIEENIEGNYEEFRRELINKLKDIQAPDGKPAIKNAWPGEEIYWGKYGDQVPDIVVLTHDLLKIRPSLTGSNFSEKKDGPSTGSHESSRNAIFMARGPQINDENQNIGDIQIYDIAPTLIHLLGLRVPENIDGRIPEDLLTSESEVKYGKYPVEKYRIRKAVKDLPKNPI